MPGSPRLALDGFPLSYSSSVFLLSIMSGEVSYGLGLIKP